MRRASGSIYPQHRNVFCGARIRAQCLRIEAGGLVRVSLSAKARLWFNTLAELGDVLNLTSNSVATLSEYGKVPALEEWRNGVLPRDCRGLFTPNLAEYATLWAVREDSPIGVLQGLESRDLCGEMFQRVFLPWAARYEVFERFVTECQSSPHKAGHWYPPNHAWSRQRRAKLTGRIPWLRAQHAQHSPHVRELPVEFLAKALTAAAEHKFCIRTAHYHPALIRTAIWTPECEPGSVSGNEEDLFHGGSVGLYLHRPAIKSVWLWSGQCECCAERRWSIEVGNQNDELGLALITGDEANESVWRELVHSCL